MVLEKTLESPWTVNLKGNQPCIFIGGIGAEALIFCTPDTKNNSLEKDPDDRKD